MNNTPTPESHGRRATRSSLACLPCRSRHVKCDGKRPCCSRCAETAEQCVFARSRRGGLDRASLAERRKRLSAADNTRPAESPSSRRSERVGQHSSPVQFGIGSFNDQGPGADISFGRSPAPTVRSHVSHLENDCLIDAYYQHFHKFHPFILPQKHLVRLSNDRRVGINFIPLVAVLRFIGNIFSSREWSTPLKDYTETCFAQASPADPVMVQCRLLYSMVLFWYDHTGDAKREMDAAVRLAVDLQMFSRGFAVEHGAQDAVLQESWRRTWWALCLMDVYYAGTLGLTKFDVLDIETTVDLPCEEQGYESGHIPAPKSLQEFDNREFATDSPVFSSFAYLIGAVRCAGLAMSTVPNAARQDSMHVIQMADSILDGWFLFLPTGRKQVMTKEGEIDELMFQAHLLIHIVSIGLHRPYSDLNFNPVESISSCAREPPPNTAAPELVDVHTVRVLRSAGAQVRLLALPVRDFDHTPFITCMISGGTLALLSACNLMFKGADLAIARGQIRLILGHLRGLGDFWPRAAKNLRDIQTVAHSVLGLGGSTTTRTNTPRSGSIHHASAAHGMVPAADTGEASSIINEFPFGDLEYLGRWYDLGNLDPDLILGTANDSELSSSSLLGT